MILSAPLLTTLHRCPVRVRLESEYTVLRIRPKELFDRLLREGVFAISNGADPAKVGHEAATVFLEHAADPGLDIASDPFTLAQDYCAMLRNVLEAISRTTLLVLKRARPIDLGNGNQWNIEAFRDELGELHRWTSVERWDADAQYREYHSWHVFGDAAAAQVGMWLHVVEIGRLDRGHQVSPWCRIFRHPAIAGHHRFRKVDGSKLEASWKAVYFADSDKNEPKVWVDQMQEDRLELIHNIQVREPDAWHVKKFQRDCAKAADNISAICKEDWQALEMHRPQCDLPPCPWQPACYAPPGPVKVGSLGGFAKK